MEDMTQVTAYTQDLLMTYGPQVVMALATLIIGWWIIGRISAAAAAAFARSGMEETLRKFLLSLTNIGLKALLVVSVAGMVGIETTSFIAVLGAAGLAVGLALQGSLGNFAGGVLILIFRPYRVGDFIEAAGYMGTVKSIEIFNTILNTTDNRRIILPNGAVSNGPITNFSAEETRRVDIVFGIGYGDDLKKGKQVLEQLIAADERILKDPEPVIVISSLGDSAVNITTRSWVKSADYWGVFFDLTENAKLALDENGISIPFPQRDVHLYKEDS